MSISGYSWTETRAENFELSDYYYAGDNETEQVLLIRKDDAAKYNTAESFNGEQALISGATMSSDAVDTATRDVFEAFGLLKG
jgi:hypothetical protein